MGLPERIVNTEERVRIVLHCRLERGGFDQVEQREHVLRNAKLGKRTVNHLNI